MRRLAFVPVVGVAVGCGPPPPPPASLALVHATVVDVRDGSLRTDQTILIDGNRVVRIAPTSGGDTPAGARIVDASDSYVVPGLWDSHVHSAANTSWHFPLLVAYGITSVRNMHTTVDTALELIHGIKQRVKEGTLLGPRLIANGPIIDGGPGSWPGAVVVHDAPEGRAAVDSLADGGADFIKVYDHLTLEAYLAIADEAASRGIPVDGHMPFQVPPEEASAGQRTVEHLSGMTVGCSAKADSLRREHLRLVQGPPLPFPQGMLAFFRLVGAADATRDPERCRAVAQSYAEHGVAVVPTLVNGVAGPEGLLDDPARMRGVPVWVRRNWESVAAQGFESIFDEGGLANAIANLRLLRDANVAILTGTDIGNPFLVPGRSLHEELGMLVDAGLSPLEALQAATLRPAETFGMRDSLGTVQEGNLADVVLLDGNPLEDIENTLAIGGVVLDGRYLDRDSLDVLLATAAEAEPPG